MYIRFPTIITHIWSAHQHVPWMVKKIIYTYIKSISTVITLWPQLN